MRAESEQPPEQAQALPQVTATGLTQGVSYPLMGHPDEPQVDAEAAQLPLGTIQAQDQLLLRVLCRISRPMVSWSKLNPARNLWQRR